MPLFRRRRAYVCRQVVELLTDYLEEALPARDRARLEAHLAACPHCSAYLEQLRTVITTVGRIGVDDLPGEAVDDLVELYRAWQRDG